MHHFGQKSFWMFIGFLLLFFIFSLGYTIVILLQGNIHVPVFEKEPNETLATSQSFFLRNVRLGLYGKLDSSKDVDVFHLEKGNKRAVSFSLLIPENDFASLRSLQMAIVGKGLGRPEGIPLKEIPSDYGALLFEENRVPKTIYEPNSFSSWKHVGTFSFEFPDSGDYYLLISDDFHEKGNYLLVQEGEDPADFYAMIKLVLGGWRILIPNLP